MSVDHCYTVAVRALCEFTAKAGDLDLRFTPSPTAKEGIAGHGLVASRRPAHYEREISLAGDYQELRVKGRADGYDPDQNRLEEIKTYRGDLELMPANHRALHWAQVKIYGYLTCQARDLDTIDLALVYFDIVSQRETVLCETFTADDLWAFFQGRCESFLQWARREVAHREARNRAMETLAFPHLDFRAGQRELAETVYKAAATGRCLLAEAPTGIGKTLGTLFPLLKRLPRGDLDKVFFLAAKTPGRQLALDTLETLNSNELRVLELVARDKACEHPDKACHGESCPLAQGFYDRLPTARAAAADEPRLTQARLRELALAHRICPYYLAQEMARWSDLVVGDYNYYFDSSAMLHAMTQANQWQVALLVDEAHNLFDRGRDMYSAELDQRQLREVKKQAPAALKRALDKVSREWNALIREAAADSPEQPDYHVRNELPARFFIAVQAATAALTDYLTEHPFGLDSGLTRFYFDALHFMKVAELFDQQTFLFDISWEAAKPKAGGKSKSTRLCLRNMIPAALLRQRFETAQTATLFSATLKPAAYYRDLLGLPDTTVYLDVASPFESAQLHVRIARHISTRYRDRAASVAPLTTLIVEQYHKQPGNYLAFFSSYEYLNQVRDELQAQHADIPVWSQDRRMDEAARQRFLEHFHDTGQGIGFAVLGGAFAEGIDLPGERLIGAFIATLGLPQSNPVNEQLKARMQSVFGEGYNYAYLYPGLRKVVQAAGRVIRTQQDQGVVHLVDDRFTQPRVQRLMPNWWSIDKG